MGYKFTNITTLLFKKHGWLRIPLYRSEVKNAKFKKADKSKLITFNFNKLHVSTED